MRILTLVDYYHPHWTGLTANAKHIAEGLTERGHGVTVLTVRHDESLPERSRESSVDVIRVRPVARLSRGLVAPGFVPALARLLPGHDVVHMHSPLLQALPAALACRARRRPLVLTHQGDIVMPAGTANRVLERGGNAMLAAAARLATCVTTFTADYGERSPIIRSALTKFTPAYPPISLPEPEPASVATTRAAIGGDPVVGFAGRFVEEKGFDYLLRAIPALADALPSVRLAFAGERDVEYESFYEQCRPLVEQHPERIVFLGLLRDRRDLAAFYAACDVVAVPSRTDCFASVVIEAMLAGTPVVVTDIPGSRVPVQETGMGILVAPRDPDALARGLLAVLGDPGPFRARHEVARRVFDAKRSLDLYETLLADAARSR